MAIGDIVATYLGTAAENYQPASGDEYHISATIKPDSTDPINIYDGSVAVVYMQAGVINSEDVGSAAQRDYTGDSNESIHINNSVYLRKSGTTDRVSIHGVKVKD
jgi:hypothetical protein